MGVAGGNPPALIERGKLDSRARELMRGVAGGNPPALIERCGCNRRPAPSARVAGGNPPALIERPI